MRFLPLAFRRLEVWVMIWVDSTHMLSQWQQNDLVRTSTASAMTWGYKWLLPGMTGFMKKPMIHRDWFHTRFNVVKVYGLHAHHVSKYNRLGKIEDAQVTLSTHFRNNGKTMSTVRICAGEGVGLNYIDEWPLRNIKAHPELLLCIDILFHI